jgi:hypothetical protein
MLVSDDRVHLFFAGALREGDDLPQETRSRNVVLKLRQFQLINSFKVGDQGVRVIPPERFARCALAHFRDLDEGAILGVGNHKTSLNHGQFQINHLF